MRVLIVGLIVLSLGVAGVSTYLIKTFSTPEAIEELEQQAEPIKMRVLVAAAALRPGAALTAESMKWQFWPEETLSEHYIVVEKDDQEAGRLNEFVGGIIRYPIQINEPILATKVFKNEDAGFLAGMLENGMRAVAVAVKATSEAAGFIFPGDRVDVLLTHEAIQKLVRKLEKKRKEREEKAEEARKEAQAEGAEATPEDSNEDGESFPVERAILEILGPFIVVSSTTETILSNIRVLAVDQLMDVAEGSSVLAKTVTLELTPEQAELVTAALAMGDISLTLRSLGPDGAETKPRTYTTDVDVSPILSAVSEEVQKKTETLDKTLQDVQAQALKEQAEEIEVLRQENEAAQEQSMAPQPAEPVKAEEKAAEKIEVLKIYRGGVSETEEITVK